MLLMETNYIIREFEFSSMTETSKKYGLLSNFSGTLK